MCDIIIPRESQMTLLCRKLITSLRKDEICESFCSWLTITYRNQILITYYKVKKTKFNLIQCPRGPKFNPHTGIFHGNFCYGQNSNNLFCTQSLYSNWLVENRGKFIQKSYRTLLKMAVLGCKFKILYVILNLMQ